MLQSIKDTMDAGAAFIGRCCASFANFWLQVKDLRIIFLVLAFTSTLLIGLDPGQDVLRDITDVANSSTAGFLLQPVAARWAALLFFCVIAGLNAWYWSHLLYKSRQGEEPPWFRRVRRGLGLLPLASIVIALPISVNLRWWEIYKGLILFAVAAVLLLAFFMTRHTIGQLIDKKIGDALSRKTAFQGGHWARGDVIFMLVTTLSSLVIFVVLLLPGARTSIGWFLGPGAVTFMAVSCIIPITSILIYYTRAHGVPVISLGLAAFVVFSICNDNHGVRSLQGDPARPLDVEKALIKWEKHVDAHAPLVIVAAAGGASRAAYWTSTVLRSLDEVTADAFSKHTFAISSVSGGSLGAIGYAAWRSEHDVEKRACFMQAFFGEDYLSPTIIGMLYPDLLQRFLPFPLMPSRSTYLEESWEKGWSRAMATCGVQDKKTNPISKDFLGIWRELNGEAPISRWTPIVLANGTHVQSGRRIITAPIQITANAFDDAIDFFEEFGFPVRASTAAHNSARFPVVSPAGTLKGRNGPKGHIVDGGYFENGGLETAYDLARTIRRLRSQRHIVVVEISNDDMRHPAQSARRNGSYEALAIAPIKPVGLTPLNEITSIIEGLYNTRSARGDLVAKRVSDAHGSGLLNTSYFHIPLEPVCADKKPRSKGEACVDQRRTTMSWLISMGSKFAMDIRLNTSPESIPTLVDDLQYNKRLSDELKEFLLNAFNQSEKERKKISEIKQLFAPPFFTADQGSSLHEDAMALPPGFQTEPGKPRVIQGITNNRMAPIR